MLLVIDVGNTNITLGIFKKENLIANFRITTRIARTSDEYGIIIHDLLKSKGMDLSQVEAVAIASVVPGIMHSLKSAIIKYLNITPFEIGIGTKTGIKIVTPNPKEIGSDRIVDAVAAYDIYGGPLIVIDFGTATTYDLITEDGSFLAGITSPGIRICADALWHKTARLPEIEIRKPASILAKDTITSMQAGLVYGYIGQTEYIVKKIMEESRIEGIKVIATGGLGKIIADETEAIHIFDDNLTLKGIRLIYNKN